MSLSNEERERLLGLLAEAAAETAGMSDAERLEYYHASGAMRSMTDAEVEARYGGYGHTTLTFIGVGKSPIRTGSIVMVQTPRGWENNMVAADFADGVVYVTEAAEWQRAKDENRAPLTVAYPAERVALATSEE